MVNVMITNTKTLISFLIKNYIKDISIAVDMTCGNGNDAKNILDNFSVKKLYCFDIQKEAIENTQNLLKEYFNYELILDSHVNFLKYIKENIDFAIYNLGYLPKGDKKITTNYVDVKESLIKLLDKLNEKGAIFITFYPGHFSGKLESVEILNFLKNLNQKKYSIIEFNFINQKNDPPFVVMIQKL